MAILEILKDVAFGTGVAGLKVIGSLAFPGAWPLIEGALDPLINHLQEKLVAEDPLDAEHAAAAWQEIERNQALVARFDELLGATVAPLREAQAELNEGQRRLLQIVDGNREALASIRLDMERMRTYGVTVAKPSIDAIRDTVGQEFADHMRTLEVKLEQIAAGRDDEQAKRNETMRRRFRDQLARSEVRAVELLNGGEFERAMDELRAGLSSLSLLIEEAPENVDLRVNLGYYYKTFAAACEPIEGEKIPAAIDKAKLVDEFNELAMNIFYFVAHGIPLEGKTAADHAHALNGMGNIHYARKHYTLALENYDLATRISPHYCYAWHDMFIAYYALAYQGKVNYPAMRRALDMTRETGAGQPGLGQQHLGRLEEMISTFDPLAIVDRLIEDGGRYFDEVAEFARAHREKPAAPPSPDEDLAAAIRAVERGAVVAAEPMLTGIIQKHEKGTRTDRRQLAIAKRYLGLIVARSDMPAARELHMAAVELDPDSFDAWHDLGGVEGHLEHIQESARCFLRAAVAARAEADSVRAGQALENAVSAMLSDTNTAFRGELMARGLFYLFSSLDDKQSLLRVYMMVIPRFIEQRSFAEAASYLALAIPLAEESGSPLEQANLHLLAGNTDAGRNDVDSAIGHYERAKLILEQTGPEEMIASVEQGIQNLRDAASRH